ncbi:MAG TPA: heme o synthase [Steroidobacteraceae bacterium]|nr:heme o synthase [Steroidobacteraceae bacterium]
MNSNVQVAGVSATWHDYLELTKPRVVALIVLTSLVGSLLASPGLPRLDTLLFANLGIALAAMGAAAINHVVDRGIDARMTRTHARPLPTGHLKPAQALMFAGLLGTASMLLLVREVNVLTALLTFGSLFGYAVVYTVWLKRATPQNIVIGGAAGAAPPILGWTAITGHVDPQALLLFLIIFVWTPPHFWALAIARRAEYAKVNIPMLPVTHGVPFTQRAVLRYSIALTLITALPFVMRMSGIVYLAAAVVLDAGFLRHALKLLRSKSDVVAMRMFRYSIVYLMWLFFALLADHYLPTTQLH